MFALIDLNEKPTQYFMKQKLADFKKTWYYRDINVNKKDPDLEYLKQFEKKYLVNLWSVAFMERKFYSNFNPYHKFTQNEILCILEKECRFFESILDEVNPDFLFINATDWHHMELLAEMCRKRGTNVFMLDLAKFATRAQIQEVNQISNSNKNYSSEIKNFDELQQVLKTGGRSKQIKFVRDNLQTSWIKNLKALKQIIKTTFNEKYRDHYTNSGKNFFSVIYYDIKLKFSRFIRFRFLEKNAIKKFSKSLFIYYPLHLEPERVLLINSPYYTNQLEVIKNIARSLPVNFELYVKEHPVMKIIGWREVKFYKEILSFPNVKLVHPNVSSEEVLKNCSLVITITGTAGIEGLFYQKPVIAFSKFWGHVKLSCIPIVEKFEDLSGIIKSQLKTQVDIKQLNDYVGWLYENTFEFDHSAHMVDLWKTFYYGGILVNVPISEKKMNEFLSQHKELDIVAEAHLKKVRELNLQHNS